jgi:hypothetical protein
MAIGATSEVSRLPASRDEWAARPVRRAVIAIGFSMALAMFVRL